MGRCWTACRGRPSPRGQRGGAEGPGPALGLPVERSGTTERLGAAARRPQRQVCGAAWVIVRVPCEHTGVVLILGSVLALNYWNFLRR